MFLHMTLLIKLPLLPTGKRFIKPSFGGSVARASAPSVSIIMFTHKSWTAVRGALPEASFYTRRLAEGRKQEFLGLISEPSTI